MKQARIDLFSQLTNDSKMQLTYQDFTVSEIKEIIDETPLNDVDKKIATYRYIYCRTFEQISNDLNMGVVTIKRRLPHISIALKTTCTKLFLK